MATTPTYTTIISDIQTALVEIEQSIVNVEAKPYAFYRQGTFPYWTNSIGLNSWERISDKLFKCNLNVRIMYHAGLLTEGADGELEMNAQEILLQLPIKFVENPRLKTTSYPTHVNGIDPLGLSVGECALSNVAFNGAETTRVVVLDIVIPIRFSVAIK